jgi:hypothetical protein
MTDQHTETLIRADPDGPSPLKKLRLKSGEDAGHARLANGDYSANQIGDLVTVVASNVHMAGPHAHAELIHVPTLVPPRAYALYAIEPMPQFEMLVIGNAKATYFSDTDVDEVTIIHEGGQTNVKVTQF